MAAASPASNNNTNNATITAPATPARAATLAVAANPAYRTDTPPKSQRGHNKPKCKQCGNVARSRCPYESCKSCCSRNQNPCHIHVLKANSAFPDKIPSTSAAPLDQQSTEPSQSTLALLFSLLEHGWTFLCLSFRILHHLNYAIQSASRVASLRQLSNSFAQFNNLNVSLRSRKPLTRKDAAVINEWRFSKLKEFRERNIEVENEAFDRYMRNVDLLEEVLSVKSMDDHVSSASESNPTPMENNDRVIPGLKLQLRSNSIRSDSVRMRIQKIVDEGLKKLQKCAAEGDINEPIDEEANKASERAKCWRTEKLSAIGDLIDKINKARSEEDLKSCLEMKFQLFNPDEGSGIMELQDNETHKNQTAESESAPAKELDYSFSKLVGRAEIDQETLITINKHFCSLDHIEEL